MRNNTRLKSFLKSNDIYLSLSGKEIEAVVIDRKDKFSFMVTGSSISILVNEIGKTLNKNKFGSIDT